MSFLWNWWANLAQLFGFYRKKGKLILLGLDNAGKTTLMHLLRDDLIGQHSPTYQSSLTELTVDGMSFQMYDIGGHSQVRRIWKDYILAMDAIVFLVDSADVSRIDEAKGELQALFDNEDMRHVPFLILGNKIDRPNAMSEEALKERLGISSLCTGKHNKAVLEGTRPVEVFMSSVILRQGYGPGFRWLLNFLNDK